MLKLPLSFYQRNDAVLVARELLGKHIYTNIDGQLTGGVIVETEAYQGPEDRGSHAYNHRKTPRNEIMFKAGGVVYMYICYGIHDMLNVVTGTDGTSHAVLIRAVDPRVGIETMRERRNLFTEDTRLCRGPGALAKALGLVKAHNGINLLEDKIWIEDRNEIVNESDIIASARVGMNYDGPYKTIPWRFYMKGNKNVSKPHI
ncbi:DNA-3-methyladenine glycosylase [Flavihumibacter sp. R14]|nr:DNA-3-methyladenine glycosylase [Flavihumibacter soli]